MEKKIKEKDMKVGELAELMLKSFQTNQEYMDKKFGAIDEKFDAIGEDFRHVHYKLDKIDKKLGSHEKTIFNHDGRIDKLEVDAKKVKKILAV